MDVLLYALAVATRNRSLPAGIALSAMLRPKTPVWVNMMTRIHPKDPVPVLKVEKSICLGMQDTAHFAALPPHFRKRNFCDLGKKNSRKKCGGQIPVSLFRSQTIKRKTSLFAIRVMTTIFRYRFHNRPLFTRPSLSMAGCRKGGRISAPPFLPPLT